MTLGSEGQTHGVVAPHRELATISDREREMYGWKSSSGRETVTLDIRERNMLIHEEMLIFHVVI